MITLLIIDVLFLISFIWIIYTAVFSDKSLIGVIIKLAIWVIILFYTVNYYKNNPVPFDNTDNKATGERSNMNIKTDYGTGCQYLTSWSGITPRLDNQGKPICKKESIN